MTSSYEKLLGAQGQVGSDLASLPDCRTTGSEREKNNELSSILDSLVEAGKQISDVVRRGRLEGIQELTGGANVQEELVKMIDRESNELIKKTLEQNPNIAGCASEEEEEFVTFKREGLGKGEFVVLFDPLDGSSNAEVNGPMGTIFSIYRRVSNLQTPVEERDFLQSGCEQVGAGYFLYGPSTMFVFTIGKGTYALTLDPKSGDFVLPKNSNKITIPEKGSVYSVNEGNCNKWKSQVRKFIKSLKSGEKPYSARYDGAFVADCNRLLFNGNGKDKESGGGVFLYPTDKNHPDGKLRYAYEVAAMASIIEQAGGMAIDENGNRILDKKIDKIHKRTSVILGSREEVGKFMEMRSKR